MDLEQKELIEECLRDYESVSPNLKHLYSVFADISNMYVDKMKDLLFEENPIIQYEEMHISDNIKLVREFLSNIDKQYLRDFDSALNDGTFDLFLPEDDLIERPEYPITTTKPQASISIPITNTIEDALIIIHEFFHFNNDNENLITIREIFTEMISIYYELRYCLFLIEKGYSNISLNNYIYSRINNTFDSANNLYFSSSVFDIYHYTGDINKNNIKFLSKYRNTYKQNISDLKNIIYDEDFEEIITSFIDDIGYVLGTLLTFVSIKQPEIYDLKMKYINDNINNIKIEDLLKILEVKIEDYEEWIHTCAEYLIGSLERLYEEDYSDSRSYRSRKN